MVKSRNLFEEFKEGQKEFGETLSAIVNFFVLTIVYFVGIGLTSITMKLIGGKFLDLKTSETRKSYWEKIKENNQDINSYYRQF